MGGYRRKFPRGAGLVVLAAFPLAGLLLAGCEQVFTFSPVSSLQRPVSSMTPGQQIAFGQDALASGDKAKMAEAYGVLSANTGSMDAQYTAARIGVELSGVPLLVVQVIAGHVAMPAAAEDLTGFISSNNLSPDFLIGAAANLFVAGSLGETLTPTDFLMGALGFALGAAHKPDGSFDFTPSGLDPGMSFLAQAFALAAVESLPPSDPIRPMMLQYQDYIDTQLVPLI